MRLWPNVEGVSRPSSGSNNGRKRCWVGFRSVLRGAGRFRVFEEWESDAMKACNMVRLLTSCSSGLRRGSGARGKVGCAGLTIPATLAVNPFVVSDRSRVKHFLLASSVWVWQIFRERLR